jgi:hypothetical protein
MKRVFYWVIVVSFLVLVVITFSPLVIPYGVYKPMLFGFPYTLWVGMLISLIFIVITISLAFIVD